MAIGQELVLLKFSAVGWWWCSLSGKLAVSGNLTIKYVTPYMSQHGECLAMQG